MFSRAYITKQLSENMVAQLAIDFCSTKHFWGVNDTLVDLFKLLSMQMIERPKERSQLVIKLFRSNSDWLC